jgi:hypothetical protein
MGTSLALWGASVLEQSSEPVVNPLAQFEPSRGRAPAVDPQTRAALHAIMGASGELDSVVEAVGRLKAGKQPKTKDWIALKRLDRRITDDSEMRKGLDPQDRSPSSN